MTTPVLSVEDVSRQYGSGPALVRAVTDVSFTVMPGEVVLVMGPSGSGKTTLLLMLGALLRPSQGRILVSGTDVTALAEHQLPPLRLRRLGFVFQDFNPLASLSARDNVALAAELAGDDRKTARLKAEVLLNTLGLGGRLGFGPSQLSGGERQRVAIARALVNDPVLVLADEPTANLDSSRSRETMQLLQRTARERGRAVIIVSHDGRIGEVADRILWIEDGRLAALPRIAPDPAWVRS